MKVSAGAKESMTLASNRSLTLSDELLDARSNELQQAIVAMVGTFNAMLIVATDGEHGKALLFKDGTTEVELVFDQQRPCTSPQPVLLLQCLRVKSPLLMARHLLTGLHCLPYQRQSWWKPPQSEPTARTAESPMGTPALTLR